MAHDACTVLLKQAEDPKRDRDRERTSSHPRDNTVHVHADGYMPTMDARICGHKHHTSNHTDANTQPLHTYARTHTHAHMACAHAHAHCKCTRIHTHTRMRAQSHKQKHMHKHTHKQMNKRSNEQVNITHTQAHVCKRKKMRLQMPPLPHVSAWMIGRMCGCRMHAPKHAGTHTHTHYHTHAHTHARANAPRTR